MRVLKHDHPEATRFLKSIPIQVEKLQRDDISYFIVVDDAWIRAIVTIHYEPHYFFAPSGSSLGNLMILNPDPSFIDAVIECAQKLVQSEGLAYIVYSQGLVPEELSLSLRRNEFEKIDHAYAMSVELESEYDNPEGLLFKPMNVGERERVIEYQEKIYSGTGDLANPTIAKNLRTLTDDEFYTIFNEDSTYFVEWNGVTIGLVVYINDSGVIASVAVDPQYRGKVFGKKMVIFALNQLKSLGWGKAFLRVHVENTHAVKLYESLGFKINRETETYVYTPTCQLLE